MSPVQTPIVKTTNDDIYTKNKVFFDQKTENGKEKCLTFKSNVTTAMEKNHLENIVKEQYKNPLINI